MKARHHLLLFAIFSVLSALCLQGHMAAYASAPVRPAGLIEQAAKLNEKGQYAKAIDLLSQAVESSQESARTRYWRGLCYFHNGQYKEAIDDLSQAISLDNNYLDAYVIRSAAYRDLYILHEALADIDFVIARDPSFREAVERKAEICEKLKQQDLAKQLKNESASLPKRKFVAEGEPAECDFKEYMTQLQKAIKANWSAPRRSDSRRVIVVFKILRDGKIENLKLDKSSNDARQDEAAMRAVKLLARVKPLPPGTPGNVDIQFTFDYNVFGGHEQLSFGGPAMDAYVRKEIIRKAKKVEQQKPWRAADLYIKVLQLCTQEERDDIQCRLADCLLEAARRSDDNPDEVAKHMHKALYYCPANVQCRAQLDKAVLRLGKQPDSFEDRIRLGDEAKDGGDLLGAVIEYLAALNLKDDPLVHERLEQLKQHAAKSAPKPGPKSYESTGFRRQF